MIKKNLVQEFLEWEKKENLYRYKYKNLPIWHLLRFHFFQIFLFEDNLLEKNVEMKNKSRIPTFNVIKSIIKIASNIFLIPFYFHNNKNKKILFLSSLTQVKRNNNTNQDIFFENILKHVSESKVIIQYPDFYNWNFKTPNPLLNIIPGDIIYLYQKLNLKSFKFIQQDISEICLKFSKLYYRTHHCDIDIKELSIFSFSEVNRNLKRINIIKIFLKILKPKKIFLYSSYSPLNFMFMFFSSKYNTKIIEVQHSHIYSKHIGYIKPLEEFILNIFPDRILVSGEFYKKVLINNGWDKFSVINIGMFISGKEKIAIKNNKNTKPIILVVSQFTISKEINNFLKTINKYNQYKFIVKLHPKFSEKQSKDFETISKYRNVVIEKNTSIEKCISKANFVFGVYSTGLLDAYNSGLNEIYIMNIKGADFFGEIIEQGIFKKLDSFEDFEIVKDNPAKKAEFISKFDIAKIKKL